MHPALSIVAFTTLSGFGYGLAAVLGLGLLDPALTATKAAHLLSLGLIALGLMSSTLHLRNPQRAWRAFSQWRSSWLSREGLLAVLTFIPLIWSAWGAIFESRYLPVPGLLGTVGAIATVFCTGMIYASLRSVQAWYTPLTPLCFLLFAGAGGLSLATLAAVFNADDVYILGLSAAVATAFAWVAKSAWRRRMLSASPISTPETATGLGSIGRVRLWERPHSNENYLTREMGYRIARKHAEKLSKLALLLGGVAPVLLLLLTMALWSATPSWAPITALLAVLCQAVGQLVERWLFFAEARHAVMNYY